MAVTFRPCVRRSTTYFNGGLSVMGNRCLPLLVTEGSRSWNALLPFGKAC